MREYKRFTVDTLFAFVNEIIKFPSNWTLKQMAAKTGRSSSTVRTAILALKACNGNGSWGKYELMDEYKRILADSYDGKETETPSLINVPISKPKLELYPPRQDNDLKATVAILATAVRELTEVIKSMNK